MPINEAVAEALAAISGDPDYATAHTLLVSADHALKDGTTAEAANLLNRALAEIDAVCPL
ncbi:hypothetical protein [Streptomyces sp. SID4982]|uniref:hypothetical protein n=1 Tax=Streptomyces sp. SID4982 TaxID=2690291 RepID=UPI00136F29B6|nr:hypothetical protein [Streptomyces sp. SID4982]MYS15040.1 hypothetical protein [Streptomyces sp. SID4982]